MKNIFLQLAKIIDSLFHRRPESEAVCQFCGETGHDTEDCPKAAKYKLFHVDRE